MDECEILKAGEARSLPGVEARPRDGPGLPERGDLLWERNGPMKVLELSHELRERRMFGFFDEFEWFVSPHRWTALTADAGAAVAPQATGVGGVVVVATGAVDNNEAAVATTHRLFRPADDRPLLLETRLQFTEATATTANVFVGLADVLGTADLLLDNGAGLKAGVHAIGFVKFEGDANWRCVAARPGSVQMLAGQTPAGGGTWQTLRVELQPVEPNLAEVTFYCDDQPVRDLPGQPLKLVLPLTGFVPLQAGAAVKAGNASGESLLLDYFAVHQLR